MAAALRLFLRRCLAATQCFTRIPVTGSLAQWADLRPELVASCARHLPAAGLVVGAAACVLFALVSLPLPEGPYSPLVAAVAATATTVWLTGALHEERASRHAGMLALVLLVAGKLALLALLGTHAPAGLMAALLAGHTVSRFWPVWLAHALPRAEFLAGTAGTLERLRTGPVAGAAGAALDQSRAGPVSGAADAALDQPVDRRGLLAAGAWCIVPLLLMVLAGGAAFMLLALAASGIVFLTLRARWRARAGGRTLDGLGFAQQATEVAFYLGAGFGLGR